MNNEYKESQKTNVQHTDQYIEYDQGTESVPFIRVQYCTNIMDELLQKMSGCLFIGFAGGIDIKLD